MTVLVHLSDPHFGTELPVVQEALTHWVRSQAPDVLVLSGDITQRATHAQFQAARAFVDGLQVPHTLVLPGNHDLPLIFFLTRLHRPYRRFLQAFGPTLEPMIERPDCLVQGVNTTRWWRHARGEISPTQVARVASRTSLHLQAHSALPKSLPLTPAPLQVVVVHQPLLTVPGIAPKDQLLGHALACQKWADAGVDLVLGGHLHRPYATPLPTRSNAWVVQAGTALSSRLRSGVPHSVNLIRGPFNDASQTRYCMLERWDLRSLTRGFMPVSVQRLPLQGPPHTGATSAYLP